VIRALDYAAVYVGDDATAARLGAGWRHVVIAVHGPTWRSVLDPATLAAVKLRAADLAALDPRPEPVNWRRIRRQIERRRRLHKRLGLAYPPALTRDVLAAIEARP